ncbi:uncharacterized protein [Temnothorax nylanderi]|uniref:uncharacterized protein n=1 Tax=Temnothorax nylanderi TaxID=102681 RepID=UPI003A86B565
MDEALRRHRRYICLLLLIYSRIQNQCAIQKQRRYWVHPILQRKQQQGDWYNLIQEMRFQNDETFFSYMRMSSTMFDFVLAKVGPKITKMETNWRRPIPAASRLAMTLRYLATGDGYQTIALSYRIGRSTTGQIIKETCDAIWDSFNADVLFTPTRNGWQKISDEFEEMWNFPNCIGALDGKHISIICPEKEGSTYYNYKGFHSVVLMALVSATYKFLIVDIGAQGRHSDGGIFKHSAMGQRFYNNVMDLPDPSSISARHTVPYVIVSDEAFQLTSFNMRPYPSKNLTILQRIYNYRLSRARRVVENAFGILASRWRIFQKPLNNTLETVDSIIKATICLHNLLMDTTQYCAETYADRQSANGQIIAGEWRTIIDERINFRSLSNCGSNNHARNASDIRNTFADYFINEGQVPWQELMI